MGSLDGKVAVVTGAGGGLGRAHALALAAEGAKVLVNDVGRPLRGGKGGRGLEPSPPDLSVAERVVETITANGGVAVANAADVSSVESAAGVVEAAVEAFGDVHILVNNAGTCHDATIEDIDDARLDADFSVNVKGAAGTIKAAFAVMKANHHGGAIVNTITGFGGPPAGPNLVAYNAAKYGVVSYTLAAASAGKPFGIRVNALCPFAITRQSRDWFFDNGLVSPDDPETLDHLGPGRNSPLVVFLASEASSHLSGRLFLVLPTSIGRDARFHLKEMFVAETDGMSADVWTVDDIERSLNTIARTDPRRGDWLVTFEGGQGVPSPS